MQKRSRLPNADAIRVLAMLMVILLHTILNFTIRPDFFATKLYFLFEPIIAVSKTCVLLFFMLSGYLVISKNRSIKNNTSKTFKKIILPLLFFTLINTAYLYSKYDFRIHSLNEFLLGQLTRITSFISSPMWFLVVLAYLYLLNPVWQKVFDKKEKPEIARFVVGLALIYSLSIEIIKFPTERVDFILNNFTVWTAFAFFYLYGALVKNKWIKFDSQKINIFLIIFGTILTIAGDFFTMLHRVNSVESVWVGYTEEYLSIPVTMTAIGLFNFLISINMSKVKSKLLIYLAQMSFGVYLVHTYVVTFLTDFTNFNFNKLHMSPYLYSALNVFIVFLSSLIITDLFTRLSHLIKNKSSLSKQ